MISVKRLNVKDLTTSALAAALVCAATMVIQIPIPLGYMHLGNCCILLISVYFGNPVGMFAGGIGSALADLLTGYPQWVLPTLLIKSLMGYVVARFSQQDGQRVSGHRLRTCVGAALGVVVMISGYTVSGCILYGSVAAGLAQIPGLALEGVIGFVLFYAVSYVWDGIRVHP